MKKFFTLISVALMAMSANAQEKYVAIERDAATGVMTLSAEFKAVLPLNEDGTYGNVATNKTEKGSVVEMKTASVTCVAIGGSTPADVPDNAGDATQTHVDMNADGTVNSWNDIKWDQKNQGDINWPWIQGTGNPSADIKAEVVMTDDVPATYIDDNGVEQTKYRPVYTVYNPDGSLGCPEVGLHYQFTASVAGTIKIGIWINKGNRNFYVVDGTTALPIKPKFEGYINGQDDKQDLDGDGEFETNNGKKYLSNEEIQALHDAAKVDATTGVDNAPYVVGAGNQAFWGYVIFDMEPGKTYYVFNDNTQVGFNGWEFTPAAGGAGDSNAVFSWENNVVTGGTVVGNGSEAENVGASDSGNTVIKVSAKKANIATDNLTFTFDQALAAEDVMEITAYRKKDSDANGTLYMQFENGYEIDEGDEVKWNNIHEAIGQQPNTNTYALTDAAGSKSMVMARSKASTNVFIIKMVINRGGSTGIGNIEVVAPQFNGAIYNLAGQKVGEDYKGIVIKNGKKFINK